MSNTYTVVSYTLLYVYLRLSSVKLSHFNDIWRAYGHGALFFLLKPKGGGQKAAWASFTV
jgi:hypothetical protein